MNGYPTPLHPAPLFQPSLQPRAPPPTHTYAQAQQTVRSIASGMLRRRSGCQLARANIRGGAAAALALLAAGGGTSGSGSGPSPCASSRALDPIMYGIVPSIPEPDPGAAATVAGGGGGGGGGGGAEGAGAGAAGAAAQGGGERRRRRREDAVAVSLAAVAQHALEGEAAARPCQARQSVYDSCHRGSCNSPHAGSRAAITYALGWCWVIF